MPTSDDDDEIARVVDLGKEREERKKKKKPTGKKPEGPPPPGGDGDSEPGEDDGGAKTKQLSNELSLRNHMQNRAETQKLVRLDTFSGQKMLQRAIRRPGMKLVKGFKPRPWKDTDTTALMEWFISEGFQKVQVGTVDRAVDLMAESDQYSSMVERFKKLPKWDLKPRLDDFLIRVCNIDDLDPKRLEYYRAVSRAFFIAICARIHQPGAKVDTLMVLEGRQGVFKSKLLRIFAFGEEELFSDSLPHNLSSKDAKSHLLGNLVIELSEIAQLDKSTNAALKAFLSAQSDKFRPPYGKSDIISLRQCVFVGTTNDAEYLKDISGNRRYWPIPCGKVDLDLAKSEIEQIYSEAMVAFENHEPWWLEDDAIIEQAEKEQALRYQEDVWSEKMSRYIMDRWGMVIQGQECLITVDEALDHINILLADRTRSHQIRIASILKTKGGRRVRRNSTTSGLRLWAYLFEDLSALEN